MKSNFIAAIEKKLKWFLGVLLILTTLIIFIQVVIRYFFFYSIPWSEELSRYLYIWMVFFGACLGIRDDSQLSIDLLQHWIKGKTAIILTLVQQIVSLIVIIALVYCTLLLVQAGTRSTSPAMGISMAMVYVGLPIGLTLMGLTTVFKISGLVKTLRKGESE